MAQKFNLLCALWIVGLLVASETIRATSASPTIAPEPTSDTTGPTTIAPEPTSDTTGPPTIAPEPTSDTTGPTTIAPEPTSDTTGPTTIAPEPTSDTTGPPTIAPEPTSDTTGPPTIAPEPTSDTTGPTETPSTTPARDPCLSKPCKDGSTCEARLNTAYVCLCLPGDSYDDKKETCERQKAFPGTLVVKEKYNDQLEFSTSEAFNNLAGRIVEDMKIILHSLGSVTIIVLKFEKAPIETKTTTPDVKATVDILFPTTAAVTAKEVTDKLTDTSECEGCTVMKGSTFTAKPTCTPDTCDQLSSTCESTDGGFKCACKAGFKPFPSVDRVCVASCPTGEKFNGEDCTACTFGYTGFNCEDSWQLNSVIIGSVFGGLLLIAVVLVVVFATKSPMKSSKKNKKSGSEKPYESHPSAKEPFSNGGLANSQPPAGGNRPAHFGNGGVPRIPRATTTSSWDNRSNLEMTPSSSRQNLIQGRNPRLHDDYDDANSYSRPQASAYAPTRPQNNPYAQSRPQVNPYAQNQGRTNPYFSEDNGRRFN